MEEEFDYIPIDSSEEFDYIPIDEPKDLSIVERGGQLGRGVAGGLGDIGDLANQLVTAPVLNLAGGASELASKGASYLSPEVAAYLEDLATKAYGARDFYKESHLGKDVRGFIDEATDDRLQGKDFLGKVLNTTGEFIGPGGFAKPLKLMKTPLATQALEAVGGASAIHGLPDITGNETIDNFLKGIVGMYGAKKVNPDTEKRLLDFIKRENVGENIPLDQKIIGKALSMGAKPDEDLMKTAKDLNVELPHYMKLNSGVGNFTEKVLSKSLASAKDYKTQQQNAHKSFLEAFDEAVNRIHPEKLNLEQAGKKAKDAFQETEKDLFNKSEELYQSAYKNLSPEDKVLPKNTLGVVDNLKKKIDKIPSPSEGDKFLKPKVNAIEEKWGIPDNIKKNLEEFKKTLPPEAYRKIEQEALKGVQQIDVPTLTSQRSALLKDLRERSTLKGARKELGEMVDALNQDIESIGEKNPNFIESWKKANKFYKEEYAEAVKSKIGNAILNGESPIEVTKNLNSPTDIQALSQILKNVPDHTRIMDMLKRAKYQDLVVDKIKTADGSLSYANLANMFTKRSKLDPLLSTVGGEADKAMRKLAQVAQGYVKTGKDVINASGTTQSMENQHALGNIIHVILSLGGGLAGASKTAGSSLLAPWALTKVMSNPRYVDQAVKYALARKNDRARKTALEKMQSIFKNEIVGRNTVKSMSEPNNKEE